MDKLLLHVRNATMEDVPRIAEILVFSKRTHYRQIFQDDDFSFGALQVITTAEAYQKAPEKIKNYWVYDDGFVKGLIHLEKDEIKELYVDPFFEHQGIGSTLLKLAFQKILSPRLWVLEGNDQAVQFYRKHGFVFTGKRDLVFGTEKHQALMICYGSRENPLRKIVRVVIDRPLGSTHPDYPDTVYPVNYGYIEGIPGGDGEPQDAYVLGPKKPIADVLGYVLAIIHRIDDNEDKWVVAPLGERVLTPDIRKQTAFQEKYFKSYLVI